MAGHIKKTPASSTNVLEQTLEGQLLIAMPTINDPHFQRSVVYMCAHSSDGAMGLVINQRARDITFPVLLEQLKITKSAIPADLPDEISQWPVYLGGPVEKSRGFVLHTSDYHEEDLTLAIGDSIGLTATLEILEKILAGSGPRKSRLALGYSGWSPGQLENEILANGWLHCPADLPLVFDTAPEDIYRTALAKIGIDPSHLSTDAGHA
ncbi:MAG TPA: YqgE/AlgH family protein [Hyphomicrobiaceae bacterium]|nr:YqgE/AlgH family protein [Hyphomicrobiaceae bacterium]